jgi:hypothetical protein
MTLWVGAYEAKISPSRWIEPSTCSCGSPGQWRRCTSGDESAPNLTSTRECIDRRGEMARATRLGSAEVDNNNSTYSKRERSSAKTNGKNGSNRPRKGWS